MPVRQTASMAITVFLVDDHQMVREGVRRMIESDSLGPTPRTPPSAPPDTSDTPTATTGTSSATAGISSAARPDTGAGAGADVVVVGEAGTADEALNQLQTITPNVAVLDLRLPDGDGVTLCREIRSRYPEVACLILTSFSDDEAMAQAVAAGAAGYVLKQIRGNELVSSIRAVASGQRLFDEETARRCLQAVHEQQVRRRAGEQLTERERAILQLIAEGKTNRQIGAELFLAEKTVKNYVSNLLAKLGMGRRSQAAAYAARLAGATDGFADGSGTPDRDTQPSDPMT